MEGTSNICLIGVLGRKESKSEADTTFEWGNWGFSEIDETWQSTNSRSQINLKQDK